MWPASVSDPHVGTYLYMWHKAARQGSPFRASHRLGLAPPHKHIRNTKDHKLLNPRSVEAESGLHKHNLDPSEAGCEYGLRASLLSILMDTEF